MEHCNKKGKECCEELEKKSHLPENAVKGGSVKMERRIMLWIVIGLLFLVALYLVFQAGVSSVAVQSTASSANSVAGAASYVGMVGGC